MKTELIVTLTQSFQQMAHTEEEVEFWYARDLQLLLGYSRWENFVKVIEKAKIACAKTNQTHVYHFREVKKMVDMGYNAQRPIDDLKLTRYACYLVAQNGDPNKEQIAFAMSYFAVQTRKQEELVQRIQAWERIQAREKLTSSEKKLSGIIYEKGVDNAGFARIRSKGDQALFGGFSTQDMKKKLAVPESKPLADFLPAITMKAKDFATEITNVNIKKDDIRGEEDLTTEHVKNSSDVRSLLAKSGILPENLPAEEDISKLKRRMASEGKHLLKAAKRFAEKKNETKHNPQRKS